MGNQQSGEKAKASSSSSSSSSSSTSYTSTQSNGVGTALQARKPPQTPVMLNVYEPSKPTGSMPGFGIFHTGLEFQGVEYSFAGSPESSGTGVLTQVPRATPEGGQWKFKQAIELGQVSVSSSEFEKILSELRDAFPANTYDLVHRNCNHFTRAVATRLGLASKYPSYINRAASWGAMFSSPPKHLQPIDAPPPKESVFKTTTGYRLDGSAVAAKGKDKEKEKKSKQESKKADKDEKKSGAASSSAGAKSGPARKNPWADPNFVPPGMRSDPVVAGAVKPAQ